MKVDDIRKEVERLNGSVGEIIPVARWVELNGPFTPEQLRELADIVEDTYDRQKRSNN